MNQRKLKFLLIVLVLGVALAAQLIYSQLTTQKSLTFALGPTRGQHGEIMEAFAKEIRAQTKIEVEGQDSKGSLQNLRRLQDGEIDFALYQSGAQRMKNENELQSNTYEVAFVCNLYSEYFVAH